jgi:hypothetical protein
MASNKHVKMQAMLLAYLHQLLHQVSLARLCAHIQHAA